MLPSSRLCRLIDDSLCPYMSFLEESELCMNKEREKQLLVSLSQVFNQIQMWTNELDSDSDDAMEARAPPPDGISSSESECPCSDHDCITKTVGNLVLLLSVESQFIQHLSGNILVAISDYLVASESKWGQFVKSLWIFLDSAISDALSLSLDQAHCLDHNVKNGVALQPKVKSVSWSSVACVVRVLRTILKHMKHDIDDELLLIYLDSMSTSLANEPWGMMERNWKTIGKSSDSLEAKVGQLESRSVFHGSLVQLFCSLINLSACEGVAKSFKEHPVICQISNLTPALLSCCLGLGNRNNQRMFEYFRHKILMLMVRLSSQIHLKDSLFVSWLNLVHEHFNDLLLEPLTQPDEGDTLEGSPFVSSVCDTKKKKGTSRHLQRLAILLFLRCSFSLIGLRDKLVNQYVNESDSKNSCKKKGLSELHWWLQIHLPSEMLRAYESYLGRCTSFSISFLRLFIDEDDILFELLLLLLPVPLCAKQQVGQDICTFKDMNDDILSHVSNILNPIQLFHFLILELHYDHQVLLDYLISKDTGAASAEYLLRSLRIICDQWTEFVKFSLKGEAADMGEAGRLSGMKRNFFLVSSEEGDDAPLSLGKHHQEETLHCEVYSKTHGPSFEKAKDCLLLLKKTLENLQQKKLFPYNPKVLLIRCTKGKDTLWWSVELSCELGPGTR